MGDLVLLLLAVVFVAGCLWLQHDRPKDLTEADIAELEQLLRMKGE